MIRLNKNSTESGMKIHKRTSVWKEREEQQRQRIELLLFLKQKQQHKKEALQQELEAEIRLEEEIWIQAVVEDTVSSNIGKYNHNDKDNNNKIRKKMKSHTHGIILVKTKDNGRKLWGPNEAKYDCKDEVLGKEPR